ncbi:hypothetical protein BDF14DRAFT_1231097 [Spinellus fusiger]|nr:hypothetical protein BDF14DRAFT_1231097 [Spinellus fusiger]
MYRGFAPALRTWPGRSMRSSQAVVGATALIRPSHLAPRLPRHFHSGFPTELRILRSAEPSLKPKHIKTAEEKATLASKAVQLAKEQAAAHHSDIPATAKPKKTIWQTIKHEVDHYWQGTKLLGLEIRISSKLLRKLLRGKLLTRREARQEF